ncbi:MAG: VanZ family protein [Phycisphaerales bacterium]|nr:VanZ family protein [Phycisphaerales bacterium]
MIVRVSIGWRRAAFAAYALAVFVATHWPRLELNVRGIERPDLLAHFAVFGAWTVLLHASELLGRMGSARTFARVWLIGTAYAAIDEALQLPAFVGRHAAWDDLAANIGGVTLGTLAAMAWTSLARRWRRAR